MHTAFESSSSPVPGLLVRLDPQAIHQLAETTEQINDRHQLQYGFIIQPQLLHRRSMDLESVPAAKDR